MGFCGGKQLGFRVETLFAMHTLGVNISTLLSPLCNESPSLSNIAKVKAYAILCHHAKSLPEAQQTLSHLKADISRLLATQQDMVVFWRMIFHFQEQQSVPYFHAAIEPWIEALPSPLVEESVPVNGSYLSAYMNYMLQALP